VLDGRYRIDTVIGTGGMGRVYKGEHTGIGRTVAIKVLHTDLSRNREAAQRFQREALASGRLDHPNIVGVSDFGVLDDGACYLVMEALEGEPLGARLEREQRIPWPEALEILRGVLAGLKHAHEKGVVHRDIKPDNIFLAKKDQHLIVKILDFGIAKLRAGSGDDPASTRAGLTVGTPAYLSPEQAVGGEITGASDLYSSTIVLVEMLAGRPPFVEKEPLAMLGAHVSRTPPTLKELAPDQEWPAGLQEIIDRGLAKLSKDRYTDALEMSAALDAVIAGVPLASARPFTDVGRATTMPANSAFGDQSIVMEVIAGTGTPAPGYVLPDGRIATPISGVMRVPAAPTAPVPPSSSAPTVDLEVAQRAVSLHDINLPPLPKRWYIVGGIVLGVGILIAIIVASASGGDSVTATPPITMPVPTIDRETELKALLHDLQTGKTCADRKEAIAKLVMLGDERAIEPLRKARYRMVGGLLGFGQDNANHCLKSAAEDAIKALGGTIKR
jgi:serine/threonine-protein kinase